MYTTISDSYDPKRPLPLVDGAFVHSVQVVDVSTAREPVPLEDLCNYARIDTESGFELEGIAKAIRKSAETRIELSIVNQTVTVLYGGPAIDCRLPRMPFKALTSIHEVTSGTDGPDIKDDFYVQGDRLRRTGGFAVSGSGTLKVIYTAGYDENETPEDIILAIKQLSNDAFCMRGSKSVGKPVYEVTDAGMHLFHNYVR